jgi:LmbE family N-acetylglucosaminyl deacetylase
VVSPHCDDAVFACADLIAAHPEATVVTLFAGGAADGVLRPWDTDCGFMPGDDVMAARRHEDREALALLGARPVWLAFRDDQYGRNAGAADIAHELTAVVDDVVPSAVLAPLGLFHRDHVLAHAASMLTRTRRPAPAWLVYEDAIYRALKGDPVGERVSALRHGGVALERVQLGDGRASALKRRAVRCYRSQLRGLASAGRAGHRDAFAPEAYWRLLP